MKFRLVATAAFGIESVVANELKGLGFENISTEHGRVLFDSDEEGIVKANLWLRCADRVYIMVDQFKATSFEELFQGVTKLPWEKYVPDGCQFPVDGKSVKSKLFSISDIQSISKKAIVKRLGRVYKKEWLTEEGPKYQVMIALLNDKVSVMLDTSGAGLHRRGYRAKGNEAPIKETLAAALVLISKWKKNIPLIDPLCGTGTILIEAAMIGRSVAPGLSRSFAFQEWSFIDKEIYKRLKKDAYEKIDYDTNLKIMGSDISERSINIARDNAELAGVDDCIEFEVKDMKDLESEYTYGYVISNPPYGERLGDALEVEELYKHMGESFGKLETWSKYVITSYEFFERCFDDKATKNRKLYNGKLKCYYYQYFGPRPPKELLDRKW